MATRTLLSLALLLPGALSAQQATNLEPTVTVSATGTVEREPEQAVLTLAVESFAPTAEEAARANAERMETLVAALRRLGIAEDLIRTVSYRLNPEYERGPGRPEGEPRIIGYRAINRVQITIDPVERTGVVIDGAIEAGANRMEGIAFRLRDPEAARLDALREAVARAQAEADVLARAAGRRLGPLVTLTTAAFGPPRPLVMADQAVRTFEAAMTPIEPGTLEVTATVTAAYRLEPQ